MMKDWKVANYVDSGLNNKETWVYYKNSKFPDIHFSRSVTHSDGSKDHIATDDKKYYYYGKSNSFNTNVSSTTSKKLKDAWKDYFTVR
ncbi:MAG: hypothetical protein AAF383_15415 [Cyanobacteria bacterium P01_A01_bin.83]